ncbi:MAG: hypothetical protein KJ069_01290 [Anaerolineae bacterium]|nr:hypothetical protein [Anaerolineae bacterium]
MKRRWVIVGGACLVGVGLFLGVSALVGGRLGFPLDDAWIHQTYARNLARYGRFEYVPGVSSAGSTSPLWTLLLAVGYLLGVPYLVWTYLLGGLSLLWLVWAAMGVWRQLWPALAAKDWLAGVTLALMWPLLWAAASGMETLLFAALGMQIMALYLPHVTGAQSPPSPNLRQHSGSVSKPSAARRTSLPSLILLGFLSGLLILTRPEGVALVALVLSGLALPGDWQARSQRVLVVGGTAVLLLLPYFLFNYWANGSLWPNTMAAKQTEYAILLEQFIGWRLAQLLWLSLGGPADGWQGMSSAHLLLLPGLLFAGWQAVKTDWANRQLARTLPLLWAGGHVLLYAWKLPVTYQHGRYLLGVMPVWILYGLAGWLLLLFARQGGRAGRGLWLAQKVAQFTFAFVLLFFLLQGAVAYATDVAIIEGEMAAMGQWLAENTPPDAVIATHDIGAIGYFAERPLLDLAGLITPEIIPLLADETAVSQYVLDSEADYLVTAPGWLYTAVAESERATLLFATEFPLTRQQGINNMAVYQLQAP